MTWFGSARASAAPKRFDAGLSLAGPTDRAEESTASYVRGGAGLPASTGRVLRVVLYAILISLVGVTIGLGIEAAHHQSRSQRLHDHGVAVTITVTGCLGLVSGTGITPTNYICHGSFALDGQRYDEAIHGSPGLLKIGHHVAGEDDAASPSDLTLADMVGPVPSTWQIYADTIWLAIAALVIAAVGFWLLRRAPRAPAVVTAPPAPVVASAPVPTATEPAVASGATDTPVVASRTSRKPHPQWVIPVVGAAIVGVVLLVRARRS
jgi:hypothetical protein